MSPFDVDAITLAGLRERQSAKYRAYPADVVPAWVAEMDFPLAKPIARALHEAIDRSDTGYQSGDGLREATIDFCEEEWGWTVPGARITGVPDVLTGVDWGIRLLTRRGEGVVVTTPVYPPFFSTISDVAERVLVDVPMARTPEGGYALDLPGLAEAFARPDVTGLVLCSPHNPSGTVPTREALATVAALAAEHGVAVIADEIHAPLTLAGAEHVPYLSVAGDDALALAVVSASKTWNLPGLKCAQLISTARTRPIVHERLPKEVVYGTGHLGVIATVAAYGQGGPWRRQVLGILDGNRHLVADLLAEHLPQARYVPPQASYLAWIDLSAYGLGEDPSAAVLDGARVALSAGPTFGSGGAGHVRLNMGTTPAILTEIVTRMGAVVGST